MATSYMTAAQVGSYFVTQYYSMLQQRPEFVHQLYSDASTMVRIDGHTRESATAMLQIHALVMSTRFTAIEIKTAHSLESWNGGVIVIVTGSVQIRDFSGRKKFSQTFFLAPQEKGFFVLNDIFHFIEEDQVHTYPASLMGQTNLNVKLNASSPIPEAVPNYMMSGGMQARDFIPPGDIKENGTADKYSMAEQRLQQTPVVESILDENSREQANGFHESPMNAIQELSPAHIEESVEEPQKHTYASVLRAAKVQSAPSVAPPSSSNKAVAPASEWLHSPQQNNQQSVAQQAQQQSNSMHVASDSLTPDMGEEVSAIDDRGEIKSVYVRNLSPSISASEIEEEFKKFGQLTTEGVAIRRLKDTDVCYAFVEYEDMDSVQSAIKAGSVYIAGRQVYIEERRANSSFARGRRGRGRATYQPDASRGRFGGRSYSSWGGGQVGGEREFNRPRGNGYHRQTSRQDKGYSANQASRNGESISE
ncbi:hypothetical protein BVRB_006630 [Beta vulgaris subsp. vulgaris]|uniref:G3BP-like protein n=1 Tax=Beta vulgaris subsp. vulgaris TaxID=3555 RepID=A0A0J8DXN0_BETVV|nr:nuclear transport factor 2 isoform X2 [Beta vulgaris subsp. vulgaris]KMS95615.1 hypothetical protein BVRB_006630 [Beta vulgaris subsp. vulgaris]